MEQESSHFSLHTLIAPQEVAVGLLESRAPTGIVAGGRTSLLAPSPFKFHL